MELMYNIVMCTCIIKVCYNARINMDSVAVIKIIIENSKHLLKGMTLYVQRKEIKHVIADQ